MLKRKLIALTLASSLALSSSASRADTPAIALGEALIAGTAAILAAGIGAVAVLGAAKISADAQVEAAKITAEGENKTKGKEGSKRTAAPTTETSGSAGGADSFLPIGPLPKTIGEWIRLRTGKIGYSTVNSDPGPSLLVATELAFEGDVLSAPKSVRSFEQKEVITYDLTVRDNSATGKTTIAFVLKDFNLSTKDLPGSVGYSQITIRATSGKTSMVWRARVDQGKKPKYDKVFIDKGGIKASNDNLAFTKPAIIPIPVELGAGKTGKVKVTLTYEGSGKRT